MATKTRNELYFKQLKSMIFGNRYKFPDTEMRLLYLTAINFCIKKMNAGVIAFRQEMFELNESGIQNRALFENGILSKFTFMNVVSVGMMQKQYAWVKNFIEKNKQFLHPKERKAAYNFNRIHIKSDRNQKSNPEQNVLHFLFVPFPCASHRLVKPVFEA